MEETKSGRWEDIRARKLAEPEARERYERTRRSVLMTRQLLQLIDAEREKAGLTKADLAERVGTSPSVVRRLLTSEASNPTLRTVLDMADVLGLEVLLQPKGSPRKRRAHRSSSLPAPAPFD